MTDEPLRSPGPPTAGIEATAAARMAQDPTPESMADLAATAFGSRQSGKRAWLESCIVAAARTVDDAEAALADLKAFGIAKLGDDRRHIPHRPNTPAGHFVWMVSA